MLQLTNYSMVVCHYYVQEKCVVSDKKFGKSFQYDLPGDLIMTYLADVRR